MDKHTLRRLIRKVLGNPIAQAIILFFTFQTIGGVLELFLPKLTDRFIADWDLSGIVADVIGNPIIGLGTLAAYQWLTRRKASEFLREETGKPQLAIGLAVGLALVLAVLGILRLTGDLTSISPAKWTWVIIVYVLFFVGISWSEEVLTRGTMQHALGVKYPVLAVLAVSAVFGLIHIGNPEIGPLAIPNTILIAVWLGLVTVQTGSILFALGFHFAWNFSLANVFGLTVSGYEFGDAILSTSMASSLASGGQYGVEGGWVATLVFAVMVAAQIAILIRSRRAVSA